MMFDTNVTVIGNVLTPPERRLTSTTRSLVTSFKIASTARRMNRDTGKWIDGNSLRVRVTCWRRLAESVAACVRVGDPVIVAGRLYTRDWVDDQQVRRVVYELEAVSVGHDLARGEASFTRTKPALATSMVEDEDAESRVRGELTERLPGDDAPVGPDDDEYPAQAYDPIGEFGADSATTGAVGGVVDGGVAVDDEAGDGLEGANDEAGAGDETGADDDNAATGRRKRGRGRFAVGV